nr:MAG TPA: hypothetical protein [Caudoviricetes sp.]
MDAVPRLNEGPTILTYSVWRRLSYIEDLFSVLILYAIF